MDKNILTNKKVLRLLSHSKGAKQIMRNNEQAVWTSKDTDEDAFYLAVFNLCDEKRKISITADEIGLISFQVKKLEELWIGEVKDDIDDIFVAEVFIHGAKLFKVY